MKLKSYFSGSVQAAMELARTELGEEALLIHARPTTPETRHLGAYEVVFGNGPAARPVKAVEPPRAGLSEDLAGMKREIELLSQSLRSVRSMMPGNVNALYDRLIASELDPELAQRVSEGTPLDQLFETDATLGRPGVGRNIVALVGPPGSGKTTTLGKTRRALRTRGAHTGAHHHRRRVPHRRGGPDPFSRRDPWNRMRCC